MAGPRLYTADAVCRLKESGYSVEYTLGNSAIYVRVSPNSFPTRLAIPVSQRSVERLERNARDNAKFHGKGR